MKNGSKSINLESISILTLYSRSLGSPINKEWVEVAGCLVYVQGLILTSTKTHYVFPEELILSVYSVCVE